MATSGDLTAVTGLPLARVEGALEALIAEDRSHVRVSASGDVVYRATSAPVALSSAGASADAAFDRKTLQLIRAREGVLSVAELVEHTGLRAADAELEMDRLVRAYGGEWRRSLDRHRVCVFPGLMVSAHGRFGTREPRPAWVRSEDPMRSVRRSRGLLAAGLNALGLGRGGRRPVRRSRFRDPATLRRYALGYVYQTALAGKGVVSLDRTRGHLQARAGEDHVRRSDVERALRALAEDFDAPITETNGDLFFGFRNVKRQFLASHLQRKALRLGSVPAGPAVYDSGDSTARAAERDLAAFDRLLGERSVNVSAPRPPL